MFDAFNDNIKRGVIGLNDANKDHMAELDDINTTLATPRTSVIDTRKNRDITIVVTTTGSPDKVVLIRLH